jgi:hypothetical protein
MPHGQAPRALADGRLSGRWRYDRTVGRGIALSYERSGAGPGAAIRPRVRVPGRFTGRWRYRRVIGRGIALSYDPSPSKPPAAPRARPEPVSPVPPHSPVVRVLCSCGELFTFDSDAGACPQCGRLAEWPTMSVVEREMRSDLEALLREHEQDGDPDAS